MPFTDSHCHLDFDEFADSLPALIGACAKADIQRIIIPGVQPESWHKVLTLAQTEFAKPACKLYAALGIHPWFLEGLSQRHLADLSQKVQDNRDKIVAIGETGIDGVIAQQKNNLAQQQEFFSFQLQLAKDNNLPVIIHHRRSHQYLLPMLKKAALTYDGIIHAFSGSYQEGLSYIELGFKLGIGGTITYPRAQKTIKAIRRLPLSSLVLETDAPSMPLNGFQGQANSPLRLIDVFQALTEVRAEPREEIMTQLESNIDALFNFR